MVKPSTLTLREQLLHTIRTSGLTASELSEASGVALMDVLYFLRGKDLGINKASKIAAFLHLELQRTD